MPRWLPPTTSSFFFQTESEPLCRDFRVIKPHLFKTSHGINKLLKGPFPRGLRFSRFFVNRSINRTWDLYYQTSSSYPGYFFLIHDIHNHPCATIFQRADWTAGSPFISYLDYNLSFRARQQCSICYHGDAPWTGFIQLNTQWCIGPPVGLSCNPRSPVKTWI